MNDTPMRIGPFGLTREDFTEERISALAAEFQAAGGFNFLSFEEREASRRNMLAAWPGDRPLWFFGYGSLMWNPAVHFTEKRAATLYGYHRRFCLSTPLGRGTPERPGLTLALERGGSCHGMAFALAPEHVESETTILWRREMLSGAYQSRWVRLRNEQGPLRAITFVVDRRHPRYAGRLGLAETVRTLAEAEGRLGRCRDYLINTVREMETMNLRDRAMRSLLDRVHAHDLAKAGGSRQSHNG